jgi:hypothetical protein
MDYSPFNPFVWAIFVGCAVLVYLTVEGYHRKHPYYPYETEKSEKRRNAVRRTAIRRISGSPVGAMSTEDEKQVGLNDVAESCTLPK